MGCCEAQHLDKSRHLSLKYNTFKIVVLGNLGVGKTSVISKYIRKNYDESDVSTTIGANYQEALVKVHDKQVYLNVWDISGEERYKNMLNGFLKGSTAALIMFDVADA